MFTCMKELPVKKCMQELIDTSRIHTIYKWIGRRIEEWNKIQTALSNE